MIKCDSNSEKDHEKEVKDLAYLLKQNHMNADMLNDMICMYTSVYTYLLESIDERRQLHQQIDNLTEEVASLKEELLMNKCTTCHNDAFLLHALQVLRKQINADVNNAIEKPSFFRKIYEMVQ